MCDATREVYEQALEIGMEKGMEKGMEAGKAEGELMGKAKGVQLATVTNIKNLMANLKWTAEQAMAALGVSAAEQAEYLALLN